MSRVDRIPRIPSGPPAYLGSQGGAEPFDHYVPELSDAELGRRNKALASSGERRRWRRFGYIVITADPRTRASRPAGEREGGTE